MRPMLSRQSSESGPSVNERVRSRLDVDLDIRTFDPDRIGFLDGDIVGRFSGADVKVPEMPWTGDCAPFEESFAQRPSLVRACIGERVDGSIDIKKCDRDSLGISGARFTGRNFSDLGYRDKS